MSLLVAVYCDIKKQNLYEYVEIFIHNNKLFVFLQSNEKFCCYDKTSHYSSKRKKGRKKENGKGKEKYRQKDFLKKM